VSLHGFLTGSQARTRRPQSQKNPAKERSWASGVHLLSCPFAPHSRREVNFRRYTLAGIFEPGRHYPAPTGRFLRRKRPSLRCRRALMTPPASGHP